MLFHRIPSFTGNQEFRKYLFNTAWMIGEKAFTMGVLLVVSIFVARHLGAEGYGVLSYAFSLGTLFAMATHMGLHGLAVRELVRHPDDQKLLLGTMFSLKFAAGVLAFLLFLTLVFLTETPGSTPYYTLLILSGIILLKPFEVFDFWFQARVIARFSSFSRIIAGLLFAGTSFFLILKDAQVPAFASAYLIQAGFTALLFSLFFVLKSGHPPPLLHFQKEKAKKLLSESWMILLAAVFAMVYLKIDQVMLRWMIGSTEVGLYSVAVQLSEAWYFIPSMIAASIFPKLIELKKDQPEQYQIRLQQLIDLLFLAALGVAVFISLLSRPLIAFLYGVEYESSSLFLSIHIWAGIFIFMRAAFSKWILIENAVIFSMITQGLGALCNVLLNLLLIPAFEGTGAALTTVFSYAMASYFALLFHSKTRPMFWMMTRAFTAPFRLRMS
ncbi:flippase [Balneolaceae bacterium ANBcel3]|nr:flippase [Balneolaceae bacterium ANBcel3]